MEKQAIKTPGNYSKVFIFFAALLLFDIYGLIVGYNLLIEYLYHIPQFMYGSTFEYQFVVTVFGGQFNYLLYKVWLFLNLLLGNLAAFIVIKILTRKKVVLPWIRNEKQTETLFAQVTLSTFLINFVGAIILILLSTKLVGTIYLAIFFFCGYLSALSIYFIYILRTHPEILLYRVKW